METIQSTSKQINILLVDNDNNLIREIKDCLDQDESGNKFGLNIIFVKNVNEALVKIAEQKVDLVITEILLPIINGYYLIKKTAKEKIPTVIYTKLKGSQDIARMAASGVDNIFIKELTKAKELIDNIRTKDSLKIDLDKVVPELQGLIRNATGEEVQSKIKMVQCPRCHIVLAPGSHFCNNCGQKIFTKTKMIKAENDEDEKRKKTGKNTDQKNSETEQEITDTDNSTNNTTETKK